MSQYLIQNVNDLPMIEEKKRLIMHNQENESASLNTVNDFLDNSYWKQTL